MNTRERIVQTALELFNREGVPKVSTNHVADEMDISPGNLYYHFKNKDEIINELFDRFKRRMDELLLAAGERDFDLDDMWLYLHLVFEAIWEYRFLYRNLVDLTQRSRSLRIHFNHILRQKLEAATSVLHGLARTGVIQARDDEINAAALNIAILASYWLNFETIRQNEYDGDVDLGPAVYQVLMTAAPLMVEPHRSQIQLLAAQYV